MPKSKPAPNAITMKRKVIVPGQVYEKGKTYTDVPASMRTKLERINERQIDTAAAAKAPRTAAGRSKS